MSILDLLGPPPVVEVPHEYGPSRVGHGEAQCKWCQGTNRENAVISPNHCDARALRDPAYAPREVEKLTSQYDACASCPRPGACCQAFPLNIELPQSYAAAQEEWERIRAEYNTGVGNVRPLPFELLRPLEMGAHSLAEAKHASDRVYWRYTCPQLGSDGRCTIYATRPDICRQYTPQEDALCVLHKKPYSEPVTDDDCCKKDAR